MMEGSDEEVYFQFSLKVHKVDLVLDVKRQSVEVGQTFCKKTVV